MMVRGWEQSLWNGEGDSIGGDAKSVHLVNIHDIGVVG